MLLVDTNVLIDVLSDDPQWADWSLQQLRHQSRLHALVINPIIYAEFSLAFKSVEALDATLEAMQVKVLETPKPALFLAGKAFALYRKRGGKRGTLLPDFLIGAHAAVQGMGILTRDVARYRGYFAGVKLIAPEEGL